FSPGGRHSLDNRRVTSSTSRSSSEVQTPFTAADYDFSFWESNSPGISLLSPTRSTFFSSPLFSDANQEDIPRSWSSRVVAHEASISVDEWDTVSTAMSAVEHHHYHPSIDEDGGAGDGYSRAQGGDRGHGPEKFSNGMIGRSSSTAQLQTSSDGGSSPLISPGGRVSSQSESALDEMDDDLLIGGGDLGRTKRMSGSGKQPLCGLPSGDAKNEIQYQSLEDIATAISPIPDGHDSIIPMGEERWRVRRRKSDGDERLPEERRRSKAEITPSHSPSRDEEEEDDEVNGDGETERKTRLQVPSSLQQSLERIEGEGQPNSVQSYLGVEMESEEEFHEGDEFSEEEEEDRYVDLEVIEEENDETRSRSVSRHADGRANGGERPPASSEEAELKGGNSIDEPSDFAPCLSPAFGGEVSTCDSISYAHTPERETATTTSAASASGSGSSDMVTSSTTSGEDSERRSNADGRSSHVSLSHTGRTTSNASTSPSEPEELAPGTSVDYAFANLSPSDEIMPAGLAFHRRAISNHETRHDEMQHARRESEIVRARSSGGRSSMMAGRCLSQVMTPVSLPISPSAMDSSMNNGRNLSSSDPALNELEQKEIRAMQQGEVDELHYDGREARGPPPVLLHRKQSNLNSWRSPFVVATARGVMNPRVQVPSGGGTGGRTATPPRVRHGTMPAGMLEREMEAEEKSSLSGSPSSTSDRVLIRSSSHSAVGGFMRRSLRFLRGESAAPLTPLTPATAGDYAFSSYSAPGAPLLARKDSAPACYGGSPMTASLRHTQSFDDGAESCLPPMWSPTSMVDYDDIEEEPGSGGRPRTPVRRAPHRRTLGASFGHARPSPAKDRLKLRPGERSRVDKKGKEIGGSTRGRMFDSLSNAFLPKHKKKTSDRSLDGFMQQFGKTVHPRRPTTNDGSMLGGSSVEGLPDEIASVIGHPEDAQHRSSTERSPSAIRSPNGAEDYSFELRSLSLGSDLWDRFGLFDQEIHSAWHEKYSTDGMSGKQLKKQDTIFELIVQERRHCAHLAFLKKGYRQRLVEEHILSAGDADRLIPDVLDAMLAFHLHLLDRLVERQRVAARVDTVADIIAEELGDGGRFTTRAVDAYTSFGAAKESAEAYYSQLLNKGGRFAGFYNKLQSDSNYRRYAYKTLLTVIIGRPTKYLLMLDQILKNEENEEVIEQTKEAAETARSFAARIDYGLQVCQMSKKWEEIKGQLEAGSKTVLHTGDVVVPFTMEDLRKDTFANDSRKILCMGDVMVKAMSVYLILFDDILVVLQRKGGRMAFIQHEQAVLPVCSLHIRSTERQNSAFVISSCKPALLQFDFLNRNDRLKWVKMLETAIARAPKQVRMTPRTQNDSRQQARERFIEEEKMRRAEEEWLKKLEAIFDDRKPEEASLATYFDSRRRWFDELRRHVGEMPYRSKSEMPDKVRQTVRARFRELRAARVIPLAEMVERCTSAREGDLWAFFDDKHEMTAGPSDDSDSSGSGKSGKQPRRIQTFHGTTSETREKSIRRHTTVPKMSECGSTVSADGLQRRAESESENDEEEHDHQETREEREERIRMKSVYRVPLSLPLRARKASSRLVDDVVQLRLENNLLRNQAALDKTRIAFLERQRAPGYAAIVAPTETMEALRRKEQEVREEETRVREAEDYNKAKLSHWQTELKEQKERLAVQEAELERKWLAYKEHTSTPSRSSSQKENGTPSEDTRREKRVERTA
ncbi:hypothetical protein PENTCL1PPCAC_24875, partial [Pristionchus entomophagus]